MSDYGQCTICYGHFTGTLTTSGFVPVAHDCGLSEADDLYVRIKGIEARVKILESARSRDDIIKGDERLRKQIQREALDMEGCRH